MPREESSAGVDQFNPINVVTVQDGHDRGYLWVSIPKSESDALGIEKGDSLVPVTQDGMLIFVPIPDQAAPEEVNQELEDKNEQ